jgi:NTP pyrophosphatase (non-canonical NTP hydrolase)
MTLNSHKGDIEQIDAKLAVELAKGELDELLEAFEKGDWEKAATECGDVMNFLISLGYNAIENYRRRK